MIDDEIAAAWIYAQSLWPSFDIPVDRRLREAKLQVWRDLFADLGVDAVRAALLDHAADEFPPPPGRLRQAALRLSGVLAMPGADEALSEVYRTIREVGRYRHPIWSHPAIAAAVDACGGWQEVCNSENPEALRAHFKQLYAVATGRSVRESAAPPAVRELVGRLDLSVDRADRAVALARSTDWGAQAPPEPDRKELT